MILSEKLTMSDIREDEETIKHVCIDVEKLLVRSSPSPSKPSIFRVEDYLRYEKDEQVYEPKVVSIGPVHHGKENLYIREEHKSRYLKLFLDQRESGLYEYVKEIKYLEQTARGCYSENFEFKFNERDFVKMLLLDSFFIIALLRRYRSNELQGSEDGNLTQQRHDLMLVENQIPFVVLYKLFKMTKTEDPTDNIIHLIKYFMFDCSPWPWASPQKAVRIEDVDDHLLSLVYRIWCSSFTKSGETKGELDDSWLVINPASELQEAGLRFKKQTEIYSSLDIEFNKGVLKIPCFRVTDETESILRNMMVYEQFLVRDAPKYIRDNVYFLNCLINSAKDVEILRRRGILTNFLGDDEMVYLMFNRLSRHILISSDFCYADEFKKVNEHCRHQRNNWKVNLKRNYFNTPWSIISMFAALMLLIICTFTQTVFTVLSYKHNQP